MLEAGGGYLGSTLGAFAYDLLGFQWATVVESGVMAGTVLVLGVYMLLARRR